MIGATAFDLADAGYLDLSHYTSNVLNFDLLEINPSASAADALTRPGVLDDAEQHMVRHFQDDPGQKMHSMMRWGTADPTILVARPLEQAGVLTIAENALSDKLPTLYHIKDTSIGLGIRERLLDVLEGATPTFTDLTVLAILLGNESIGYLLEDDIRPETTKKNAKESAQRIVDESLPHYTLRKITWRCLYEGGSMLHAAAW